jgi:hypothetical protein
MQRRFGTSARSGAQRRSPWAIAQEDREAQISEEQLLFENASGYSGTRDKAPNMKIQALLIIFLSLLASLANTFDANAQDTSACAILGAESIPFQHATRQSDPGYRTIETASYKGVTFYLKAGHGVARLEAVVLRKLIASTFYSYGRDPKETDSLRLSVRALNGKQVEAQCSNVDSHLP